MALSYKTPAVYIEEQPATGPIEGVGTSTAALLGPALDGPISVPTKVTNWTQYKAVFGEFSASPRLFLPHAVRGFFENGGTVAYIVRVGTAVRASWLLADRGNPAGTALKVEAQKEGTDGNAIRVAVQASVPPLVTNTNVLKGRAALKPVPATTLVTLANVNDASKFRVGDLVVVEGAATRYEIARIAGDQITLATALAAAVAGTDFLRIADPAVGQKRFRVDKTAGIEPGSALRLAQAGGNAEDCVVDRLEADAVVVAVPLTQAYTLAQNDAATTVTSSEFT